MARRSGPLGPSMASLYPGPGVRVAPRGRRGHLWAVCSLKRRYLVLCSLLRPRQTDFGALDVVAIKDALSGLEGHVDHRPVSVQLDEPAAVYGPQESRTGGIIEGPPRRTPEQRNRIPPEPGSAVGPIFGVV